MSGMSTSRLNRQTKNISTVFYCWLFTFWSLSRAKNKSGTPLQAPAGWLSLVAFRCFHSEGPALCDRKTDWWCHRLQTGNRSNEQRLTDVDDERTRTDSRLPARKQSPKVKQAWQKPESSSKQISVEIFQGGVSISILISERVHLAWKKHTISSLLYFHLFWLARSLLVTLNFVQPSLMALDNIVSLVLMLGAASPSMEGAAWVSSSGKL